MSLLCAALLAGCASGGKRSAPLDPELFLTGAAAPPTSYEEALIPFESSEAPAASGSGELRALDSDPEAISMPPRPSRSRSASAGLGPDRYEYLHDEDGVWYEGYYYAGGAFVEGEWEDGYFEDDGYYVPGGVLLGVNGLQGNLDARRYKGHHGEGSTGYEEVKRATAGRRAGPEERSRPEPTPRSRDTTRSTSSGGASRSGSSPKSVRPRGAPESGRSAPPPSGGGGTRPPR